MGEEIVRIILFGSSLVFADIPKLYNLTARRYLPWTYTNAFSGFLPVGKM